MEDDSNSWPSYLYLPKAEITPKFQLTGEENFMSPYTGAVGKGTCRQAENQHFASRSPG